MKPRMALGVLLCCHFILYSVTPKQADTFQSPFCLLHCLNPAEKEFGKDRFGPVYSKKWKTVCSDLGSSLQVTFVVLPSIFPLLWIPNRSKNEIPRNQRWWRISLGCKINESSAFFLKCACGNQEPPATLHFKQEILCCTKQPNSNIYHIIARQWKLYIFSSFRVCPSVFFYLASIVPCVWILGKYKCEYIPQLLSFQVSTQWLTKNTIFLTTRHCNNLNLERNDSVRPSFCLAQLHSRGQSGFSIFLAAFLKNAHFLLLISFTFWKPTWHLCIFTELDMLNERLEAREEFENESPYDVLQNKTEEEGNNIGMNLTLLTKVRPRHFCVKRHTSVQHTSLKLMPKSLYTSYPNNARPFCLKNTFDTCLRKQSVSEHKLILCKQSPRFHFTSCTEPKLLSTVCRSISTWMFTFASSHLLSLNWSHIHKGDSSWLHVQMKKDRENPLEFEICQPKAKISQSPFSGFERKSNSVIWTMISITSQRRQHQTGWINQWQG